MRFLLFFLLAAGTVDAQNFQWAFGSGTWVDDYPNCTTFDENGNIYSTGHVYSGAKFGTYQAADWGFFLMKQNQKGDVLWTKFSSESYNAAGTDICVDRKGNVYVVGSFAYDLNLGDTVLFGGGLGPMSSMFLIKYDKDGKRLWVRNLGINGQIGGGRLAVDKSDNIYLAGSYIYKLELGNNVSLTGSYITYWPYSDIFLCKFNSAGVAQWGLSVSSNIDDYAVGVEVGSDQNVYLVGQYGSRNLKIKGQSYDFGENYGSFVLRSSLEGSVLNSLPINATVNDFKVDSRNNIITTGPGNNPRNSNTSNTFLSKYDLEFKLIFTKTLPTNTFYNYPRVATNGQDIYISGNFYNGLSIDNLSVGQSSGCYLIKVSEIGYAQWLRVLSSNGYLHDQVNSMDAMQNNLVVAGTYNGSSFNIDGQVLNNNSGNGDADIFIASMVDVTTTVCPPKSAKLLISDEKICNDQKSTLSALTSDQTLLKWYKDAEIFSTGYDSKLNVSIAGNYYYVKYSNTTCADTSNYVTVKVLDYPAKKIASETNMPSCGRPVQISVAINSEYSYEWFKNDERIPDKIDNQLITDTPGKFYCRITNGKLCSTKTDPIDVFILPIETNFLLDTVKKCKLKGVSLSPINLKYNQWEFEWTIGSKSKEISVNDSGVYGLTLRKGSCSYYDEVVVENYPDLWFPNVITPNNDGKNDFYEIKNLVLPIKFSVFNRWGDLVFSDEKYLNNWSADNLASGVYFYSANDVLNCSSINSKGWLTVIK